MIYRILLLALGCMVFNATLWAANHTQVAPAGIVKNWFVGLESSALFPVFKGQHSNLPFNGTPAGIVGSFNTNSGNMGTDAGIFIGYAMYNRHHWFSQHQISIEITHTITAPQAIGYADYVGGPAGAQSYLYSYSYNVKMTSLGFNIGTNIYNWQHYAIFTSIGMGNTWLQSNDFNMQPLDGGGKSRFHFIDNDSTSLYYQLKLGIRYRYKQNAPALVYTYKGLFEKVLSGDGTTSFRNSPGIKDKLYINGIQLRLTHYL